MESRNLNFYDPQEKDWNEFINHFHDPDLLYLYIKQIYNTKDVKKLLTEVPDNKKDAVSSIYKLEVFRATMQYVEEFTMYFLAYIDGIENIGQKLVKTSTTKEVKEFLRNLKDRKENEFSKNKKSLEFEDLLKELFGYNLILQSKEYEDSKDKFDELIIESINIIKNDLFDIARYYIDYLQVYNAIKHGTRVFPLIKNETKIDDKVVTDGPKNSIIVICKDESENARPSILNLPIEYIIDSSLRISDKTHIFFKCIRDIIRDRLINPTSKKNIKFFKINTENSSKNDSPKEYIRAVSGKNIIIMEKPDTLEVNDKPITTINAFKIISKGKNIFFHTKFENEISLEYPFLIKSEFSPSSDITPGFVNNINFNYDLFDLHIGQYIDLIKISELQTKSEIKNVTFVNDLTNKNSLTGRCDNLKFPEIKKDPNMKFLLFLLKLEKATAKLIPLPKFLSEKQNQIINENIDKNLSRKEAETIVTNLKSDDSKDVYTTISTEIVNFNGTISSRNFEPVKFNININFKNSPEEKQYKEEIFEIPGKSFKFLWGIDEIPGKIIENIDLLVKGEITKLPEIKDVNMPIFELIMIISYNEPIFWYKEHFVKMIFRPVKYFNILSSKN